MDRFVVVNVVFVILGVCETFSLDSTLDMYDNLWEPHERGANPRDAFSDDINECLFSEWTKLVLSRNVDCSSSSGYSQLCYSPQASKPALFAVCYDTHTLIPAFTGHLVKYSEGKGRPAEFRTDQGKYAPSSQAAVNDYNATKQQEDFPEFNERENYYCAKGHLTPNSDFGGNNERVETFILTNAAPQWQRFNEGNWLVLEAAIRNYVEANSTVVFVVTGTGGIAKDQSGNPYILNGRVQAPKYYWKAICNPTIRQSIVYVGTNSVGIKSKQKTEGCNGKEQSQDRGVMYCDSLQNINNNKEYSDFKLPPFYDPYCKTSERGTFLDPFIDFK